MSNMKYAAYGSNLHPHRLQLRVPSANPIHTALVEGWQLKFHKRSIDGSAKCNVVRAEHAVFFAVFEIDEPEKQGLDQAEGLGRGYEIHEIEVPGAGTCFTYRADAAYINSGLKPYSWYKKLVMLGLEYHKAPEMYLKSILKIDVIRDPDNYRQSKNMEIVEAAKNYSR